MMFYGCVILARVMVMMMMMMMMMLMFERQGRSKIMMNVYKLTITL